VAWSPDGKRLVTSAWDSSKKIQITTVWDALGNELFTLGEGNDTTRIMSATWSPDGKRLATANEDGIVHVYAMDILELMALARQRVTHHPSEEGCLKYFHVNKCPSVPELSFW
jgi:WD40 repeat protein